MSSEAMMAPLRLVDMCTVLDATVEAAVTGLHDLAATLPRQSDAERKRALLQHLHTTKQRLLRLHVVTEWGLEKANAISQVSKVLEVSQQHTDALRDAADQMAYLHGELSTLQAPIYDVPTAAEVLECGSYPQLPAVIEELRPPPLPRPDERTNALHLMDHHIRSQLLKEDLVDGIRVASISSGKVVLTVESSYDATLTLVPAPETVSVLARYSASVFQQQTSASEQATVQAGEQPGGELQSQLAVESAAAGQEGAVPMEMDGLGAAAEGIAAAVAAPSAAAEAGAAASEARALGGGPAVALESLTEATPQESKWRWRLLSFNILPEFVEKKLLQPEQTAALQAAIEERMWAAADGAALRQLASADATPSILPSESSLPSSETTAITTLNLGTSRQGTQKGAGLPPLGLMHGILRDTAAKLLCAEAIMSARSVSASSGRWHRQLEVTGARLLTGGMRLTFWPRIPILAQRELEPLPTAPSTNSSVATSELPPTSAMGAILEVGFDSTQRLVVLPDGVLADAATAMGTELALDSYTADIDSLLLRAAATIAHQQLEAVKQLLEGYPRFAAQGGTLLIRELGAQPLAPPPLDTAHTTAEDSLPTKMVVPAQSSEEVSAALTPIGEGQAVPVLEARCHGSLLLSISMDLRSGRIRFRMGETVTKEAGLEFEPHAQKAEEIVTKAQAEAAALVAELATQATVRGGQASAPVTVAAPQRASPAMSSLKVVAQSAERLFVGALMRMRFSRLTNCAYSMCLQSSNLRSTLVSEYVTAHPGARSLLSTRITLAFPPGPPLTPFPAASCGSLWSIQCHLIVASREAGDPAAVERPMQYDMVLVQCSAHGLPVQVLKMVSVPEAVAAASMAAAHSLHARDHSAEHQPSKPQQRSKRKREDDESPDEPPRDEMAVVKIQNESGAEGGSAEQRATEEAAELRGVVEWCCQRLVWNMLQLQLQAMKLSWTEIGYWEGAHWQNTLSQCSDARQCPHISSIAQAPHTIPGKGRYRRCLHLGHLSQLASLDEATLSAADSSADADQPNGGESVSPPSASAKPAGPYSSGFELEVLNSEDSPVIGEGWSDRGPSRAALRDSRRWRATLRSPYLASLQLGTGFPRPIQRIPGGVSFDYSLTAGDTVLTAVSDMSSIVSLHSFLQRTRHQLETHPPLSEGAPVVLPPLLHHAAIAAPPATVSDDMAHQHAPSGLWNVSGSGSVAVHDITLHNARLVVTPAPVTATGAAETEPVASLQLGITWVPLADGVKGTSRCRLTRIEPEGLPPVFLASLEVLAQKGKEEEMLNALVVAGPSVAAAMCALDHHQLQELGVDPGLISVSEPRPPYCLRIQLQKVTGVWISINLTMTAGQLVWIGLTTSCLLQYRGSAYGMQLPNSDSGAAADSLEVQASATLLKLPRQVPGVHLADTIKSEDKMSAANGVEKPAANGVWVQSGALTAALKALVVHLVNLI